MQWSDALGYEEVMTFLRSTPANLFFKDTECRYLFVSDSRTFFPYGEGQEEDVLGRQIWRSGATRNRPVFIMNRIKRCLLPAREPALSPRCPGRMG